MVLTNLLHKILFTFSAVDRTCLNPDLDARMKANAIGGDFYVATIFGYIFSLLNLVFWIPNTYLFHYPEQPVKITIAIITAVVIGPFTRIACSEPYHQFVMDHCFDSKYPTKKWYLLSYGLYVGSMILSGIIIIFI